MHTYIISDSFLGEREALLLLWRDYSFSQNNQYSERCTRLKATDAGYFNSCTRRVSTDEC
jgi:hypothetical protein